MADIRSSHRTPDFPTTLRPDSLGGHGMVSSSHPVISRVGADVLDAGGNAIDAALAMAATAWLVLPGQCGVGGDAFALVREPDRSVRSFGGSGFGPDGGTPAHYAGLRHVPRHGPRAVAVPGAVAALGALHSSGARRSLPELWAPAVAIGRLGLPCSQRTRGDIAEHAQRLADDPEVRAALLPDGVVPTVGTRLAQQALADTIERLARDPADLYTGELAERAVRALTAAGAPFSGDEWEATGRVVPEPALRRGYRGLWVHQTPMPTPGWMVLDQLAMCDGELDARPPLCADAVHWLAGAARIAFDDRYRYAGSDSEGWRHREAPEAVAAARDRIATGDLPSPVGARADGDTTSMVVVDEEGRAVSLIESLAFTFGSGTAVPGTGVVLNNRLGRGAYLHPGSPNEVRPRRRPLHTLNAWLVTDDDRLLHVGNTPGGDGQVQWNTQLVSHLVDHGSGPQDAVDAPRFSVFPGSDAEDIGRPAELRCEERLGAPTLRELAARGHAVVPVGAWGAGGSAQVVTVDHERGVLLGGADSRQEGLALGVR